MDEFTIVLNNIKERVPSWIPVNSPDDLEITRLNGRSNAVFRVHIPKGKYESVEPRTLLYRRFE